MPQIRLLIETPGRKAGAECLHEAGEVINVDDGLAQYWIQEGRAEFASNSAPDYSTMTIVLLRELAKERGVPYSGKNKAALVVALEQ